MENKIDYKNEVLKVYPNAVFHRVAPKSKLGAIFIDNKSYSKISDYTTDVRAWKLAYELINALNKQETKQRPHNRQL